jgi:hypothetical protein
MKSFALILFTSILLFSCKKDNNNSPDPLPDDNAVQLINPQNGQQSTFYRYTSTCGSDELNFTGDTLVLEVVQNDTGVTFVERFKTGSPNFGDSVITEYPVKVHEGYLLLDDRLQSRLFFFYGNDTLFTAKPHTIDLEQGPCLIELPNGDPFRGEEIGNLALLAIGDISHESNTLVSCVPGFFNLDAYLAYDNTLRASYSVRQTIDNSVEGYVSRPSRY